MPLFFELIQVSLGNRETLSRVPTADEWQQLYDMAERQAILGICFVGVSRLHELSEINANDNANQQPITDNCEPITKNLPRKLFIRWAGRAAIIQERNELLDKRCIQLQQMLLGDGFRSSILKGQGVAQLYKYTNPYTLHSTLYTLNLSQYRQPGDIDALLWPFEDGTSQLANISLSNRRKRIISYARSQTPNAKAFYHHVDVKILPDAEVELHYTPSWFYNPLTNRRFQKWVEENRDLLFSETDGLVTPSIQFNVVYILIHIYQHLFQEGIGLRQLIDYYFVLRSYQQSASNPASCTLHPALNKVLEPGTLHSTLYTLHFIKELGLEKFASALLWVINEVCIGTNPNQNNPASCSEINPASCIDSVELKFLHPASNEPEGRFLLSEIMQAGNFGKYDERIDRSKQSLVGRYFVHLKRNMHFLTHYPSEVLWSPFWKLWQQLWIRTL